LGDLMETDGYWAYAENLRRAIIADPESVLKKIKRKVYEDRVVVSVPLPEAKTKS
jgi:hypothetical protein